MRIAGKRLLAIKEALTFYEAVNIASGDRARARGIERVNGRRADSRRADFAGEDLRIAVEAVDDFSDVIVIEEMDYPFSTRDVRQAMRRLLAGAEMRRR